MVFSDRKKWIEKKNPQVYENIIQAEAEYCLHIPHTVGPKKHSWTDVSSFLQNLRLIRMSAWSDFWTSVQR